MIIAAGDMVQKILRPLITQPSSVRVPCGRSQQVRPGSLTPAATIWILRAFASQQQDHGLDLPAATAIWQRRPMLPIGQVHVDADGDRGVAPRQAATRPSCGPR
jgi:hypothetical protein